MKTNKFASLLLLAVLVMFGYPMQVYAGLDSVWVYTHYDLLANLPIPGSMEIDSNNRINILYPVSIPGGLEFRFARQTDAGWEIEAITTVGNTSTLDLALDANNNPHVVFRDRTPGTNNLVYYYKVGGTWLHRDVTAPGTNPDAPTLQIDQSGYPHLVVYMGGNNHYFFWDGAAWTDRVIPNSGQGASLALDSNGKPLIAFGKNFEDIAYAEWNTSDWVIQDVDVNGKLGLDVSLALDADYQPHIAYWDWQTGNLKYAHRSGETEWAVTTVGGSGRVPSIAIDSAGNPHISSISVSYPGILQYSYWNGTSWQIEQVTSFPGTPDGSLRLTKTDQPRILITQQDLQNSQFLPQKILFKGTQHYLPLVNR
jgi:hypothetical protein